MNELFLPGLPGHLVGGELAAPPKLTLAEFDAAMRAFVVTGYNQRVHSETGQEPQPTQSGARAVALGARIARHTAAGWDNAAVPDDVADVAAFLNLAPAAATSLLLQIDTD